MQELLQEPGYGRRQNRSAEREALRRRAGGQVAEAAQRAGIPRHFLREDEALGDLPELMSGLAFNCLKILTETLE